MFPLRQDSTLLCKLPHCLIALATLLLFFVSNGCQKKSDGAAREMPPTQVVAVEALLRRLEDNLPLVGSVVADEVVDIRAETDGAVLEILFKEGDLVEAGQLLIKLDDTRWTTAMAQTEAALRLANAEFDRNSALRTNNLVSLQDFERVAATLDQMKATIEVDRRRLRDARITAPFRGRVGARYVSPGQVIARNTVLTVLVNSDPVKLDFEVPERYVGTVSIGQNVSLDVASRPGRRFEGKVYFISPTLDATNRTVLVKASVPNLDGALKPGMFANLNLTLNVRESAVVIPEASIAQLMPGDKAMIMVVDSATNAQTRTIGLGLRLPGRVEVREGLKAGERVVVEGLQKIVPGRPVRLAPAESGKPYLDQIDPAPNAKS